MRCRGWPLAIAGLAACARAEMPPGGAPDKQPPRVIATTPEPMAVVPGWGDAVVFRFDERISERGVEEAVLVSPETGELRLEKGRSELRIRLEGGWRPGLVYRVVVLPVIQDLFGNRRQLPAELVFSTGPPIAATALAGFITDRLSGRPAADARIEAMRQLDSVSYVGVSDTAGFFALRHVPAGRYHLLAYLDQNRNRKSDPFEPRDSGSTVLSATDTALLAMSLLAPDTTPARLARADARDSLHVALVFDDYMDPQVPQAEAQVALWRLPDSTRVEVREVLYPAEAQRARVARQQQEQAEAQVGKAPPEVLPADTAVAAAAGEPAPPLPTQELVVIPAEPLEAGTRYRVEAAGITNIHGLPGGGGGAVFQTRARAAAPPADSVGAAPRDTAGTRAVSGLVLRGRGSGTGTGNGYDSKRIGLE
ncbi:MAG: hypothetical protein HY703_05035 [Gemmatimonadetes bacterium]|nr:hypothetical protein [Gemmatimonadota bacterium]